MFFLLNCLEIFNFHHFFLSIRPVKHCYWRLFEDAKLSNYILGITCQLVFTDCLYTVTTYWRLQLYRSICYQKEQLNKKLKTFKYVEFYKTKFFRILKMTDLFNVILYSSYFYRTSISFKVNNVSKYKSITWEK